MMAQSPDRSRLDDLLVARGLFESRSRARDAVRRGTVRISDRVADKPGASVPADAVIAIDDPARRYVSRASLKLIAALDTFGLDPTGLSALDLGASTGGFTQVLLERGAAHVTAIDVGHSQIHPMIAADPRVTVIEGLNARNLTADDLTGGRPQVIVCDVSFISLRLALPPALSLALPGATGVFLVKPQFEVGRDGIGKGGLLRDPARGEAVAAEIAAWLADEMGWSVTGLIPSPIEGGDGNAEFLLAARKAGERVA